jgi:hypothetical protein
MTKCHITRTFPAVTPAILAIGLGVVGLGANPGYALSDQPAGTFVSRPSLSSTKIAQNADGTGERGKPCKVDHPQFCKSGVCNPNSQSSSNGTCN